MNLLEIGKITKHHGIRGEVKISPYSDYPERFLDFEYLIIGGKKYEIEFARLHKNAVLVKFEGYDLIEDSLHLINSSVYIPREFVDDLEEGHFIVDIIGCTVVDEQNNSIGIIKNVITGAQDLYEIESVSGKVFYIPVVDQFVKSIDIEAKKIVVALIEGLVPND